ncbi:hypothetical protein ACET3Z_013695 [Daucus carota]
MALNQIHYGTIAHRRNKENRVKKHPKGGSATQQGKVTSDFIQAHKHLIEPSVLIDALKGHDKSISLALGQIHHHTLPKDQNTGPTQHSHSYKAALQIPVVNSPPKTSSDEHSDAHSEPSEVQINLSQKLCDGADEKITEEEVGISEEEVVDADLNPLTPRYSPPPILDFPDKALMGHLATNLDASFINTVITPEEIPDNNILLLNNWKPREEISSPSFHSNTLEDKGPDSDEGDHEFNSAIQTKLLKDLEKLRVKSNRGRPRKNNPKAMNKHFKLPRRKKLRGEGLQQTSHFFLNNAFDEAESIYETGVLMGLLPTSSKSETIQLIKENLSH